MDPSRVWAKSLVLLGLAAGLLLSPAHARGAEQPGQHNDAFAAPDLPLRAEPAATFASVSTPGYYQTSEYMTGSVAVGIVLVESDGSVDASTEDWTETEKQQVFAEIASALDWWAGLEPRAHLRFVYDDHFSQPLPTGVEPITRPYGDQSRWIADTMGSLGYDASSYFTRVRDYVNDLRDAHQTDWAFTIFVVDSSSDADNRFSDGYFAYAYLGGPFMVMTYGNNGYGAGHIDAVAAHEIGHIFGALDQYCAAGQSCTCHAGYLDVENQNSQFGACASDRSSIMRGGVFPYVAGALDPYAAGQVGWRDSDGDDILDPLDTAIGVSLETAVSQDGTVTATGRAEVIPFPSPSRDDVTINTLTEVRYRFDGSPWQVAQAHDGAFDGAVEGYRLAVRVSPGRHTLEVIAEDSAGNLSHPGAAQTILILDPIDGGLNTELYAPEGMASMEGAAYHMEGTAVAEVQYRVDGGGWRSAAALDGAFDSDEEAFRISLDSLSSGTHWVEACAVDCEGNTEINCASREIVVTDTHTVFLPFVIR